jgi:thiamine pyrophosphate-dependent acetolactate synthase large subunit-like protein
MDTTPQEQASRKAGGKMSGSTLLARALARQSVDTLFYLMGAPTYDAAKACLAEKIRIVDARHEQGAALMAQAYARVLGKPAVCMASSGPGTVNLASGLANALVDCAPVVALGGASPLAQFGSGAFQEIDQVAVMRPLTKWAERVYDARRIPQYVDAAFGHAICGRPGPVYLDFPGDVLDQEVDEDAVRWPRKPKALARAGASPEAIARAVQLLEKAERPVILSGSGILWSHASMQLQQFVESAGVPFYTTPQGRGVIPEDHPFFYAHARSTAYKEADLVLVVGTRLNHVFGFGRPPRFSATARFLRIDTDADEIHASPRLELGIVADARTALEQLAAALAGRIAPERYADWRERLASIERERAPAAEQRLANDQVPIHPLRLCREIRDFIDRDAILVVDGQEILNYGRQTLNSYFPGHRLNSGPFGMMGVGVPFGVGAKAAKPGKQVVVLTGDGAFGMNGMELDTAIRHKLPMLVVISLNGGWTADPDRKKPARDLGYTRYEQMAEALGCHAEYVERPNDIRPALQRAARAVAEGRTAVVNVVTDWTARAETSSFARHMT